MKNYLFLVFALFLILVISGCSEDPQLSARRIAMIECGENGCGGGSEYINDAQSPVITSFEVYKTGYTNNSIYTVVKSGSATDNVGIYKVCTGMSFTGIGGGYGDYGCAISSTPVRNYTYYRQSNYSQPGNYSFTFRVYDAAENSDTEVRSITIP